MAIAAILCLAGAVELVLSQARITDSEMPAHMRTSDSWPYLLAGALGRSVRRSRQARADLTSAWAASRAQAREDEQRRAYEQTTAGKAELAFNRGDQFFSIELPVDNDVAQHLNAIYDAGWREHTVARRHTRTVRSEPRWDGTHNVNRETVEYRTYIFRRGT